METDKKKTETKRRGTSALTRLLGTRTPMYRVWTGEKMCYSESGITGSNGHVELVVFYTGYEEWDEVDGYLYMQFIGERAIHEKEIYEGDILEIRSRGLDFNCIVGRRGRLMPNDEFSRDWQHMLYRPDWGNAKIIGNIFENPDLIDECT